MPRLVAFLLLAAAATGCARKPPLEADLVPADALAALLPDSIGAFGAVGDEVYRGYFADSMGALTLVTVARTYKHGELLMTLNVSSLDRPDRYRAVVEGGGGQAVADSILQTDPVLQSARAAGWEPYAVQYGWLLLHPDGRVVEAKSLARGALVDALGSVDLGQLIALPEARTAVDASFVRVVARGREAGPRTRASGSAREGERALG